MSWYRQALDPVLAKRVERGADASRSSSGESRIDLEPDVSKTSTRGFATCFLQGQGDPPGRIDSPKMVGEYLGTVTSVRGGRFVLDSAVPLNSGDGLCWFDEQNELCGTAVNAAQPIQDGLLVTPQEIAGIRHGLALYRNRDHVLLREVERSRPVREISVHLRLDTPADGFALTATDEDGNTAASVLAADRVTAEEPERAVEIARRQLAKTGGPHSPVVTWIWPGTSPAFCQWRRSMACAARCWRGCSPCARPIGP